MPSEEKEKFTLCDKYNTEEKCLCELIEQLCGGIKVCLGYGPGPEGAWVERAKGKAAFIVIDKRICSSALFYINDNPPKYNNSISMLLEHISHVLAHLKIGDDKAAHDLNFYKKQSESMITITTNYLKNNGIKTVRAEGKHREFVVFRKVMWTKTTELADKTVAAINELAPGIIKECTRIADDKVELMGRNVKWAQYQKIMRIFTDLEHVNSGNLKFSRAHNQEGDQES